jgi:hypothetical protein
VLKRLKLAAALALGAVLLCAVCALAAEEYFRDNFSPESPDQKYFYEGTMEGKNFGYVQGGMYAIDTTGSDDYGQSVLLHDLTTYEVEARAQLKGNTSPKTINGSVVKAGWGVTLNYIEDDNGVEHFLVALLNPAERNFTLVRVDGDKRSNLLGPMTAESVQAGANVLRVKADAGRIVVNINGTEVGSVFERNLLSGGFGLYATPRTRCEYDYIAVYTEAVPKSLVEDDFSGQPARWFTGLQDGVAYAYEDGEYTMDATQGDKSGMSLFAGEHSAFELEVMARKLGGEDNYGYGVFFQDIPNEKGGFDQFRFLVSNDGWFTVQRSFQDVPRALFEWAECDRIVPGQPVALKVKLLGGRLRFFINGYIVYELTDIPAVPGKLGLYASSGVKAGFDDLKLSDF